MRYDDRCCEIVTADTFISSLTFDHTNGDCFLYTECTTIGGTDCEQCLSGEENMIMKKNYNWLMYIFL